MMKTRQRTGRKPKPVNLDAQDAKLLREVAASPYWRKSQVQRAQAVLAMAEGVQQAEIAAAIGYSVPSIYRACLRYAREGIAGLLTEKQLPGRPRRKVPA
jgi:transposase